MSDLDSRRQELATQIARFEAIDRTMALIGTSAALIALILIVVIRSV